MVNGVLWEVPRTKPAGPVAPRVLSLGLPYGLHSPWYPLGFSIYCPILLIDWKVLANRNFFYIRNMVCEQMSLINIGKMIFGGTTNRHTDFASQPTKRLVEWKGHLYTYIQNFQCTNTWPLKTVKNKTFVETQIFLRSFLVFIFIHDLRP